MNNHREWTSAGAGRASEIGVHQRRRPGLGASLMVGAAVCAMTCAGLAQAASAPLQAATNTTWRGYQGGPHSSNYSALKQITAQNVSRLQVAWTYNRGAAAAYVFSPIVIDRVMYTLAQGGKLVALDATTGRELWAAPLGSGSTGRRGIMYWQNASGTDRRIFVPDGQFIYAHNAANGEPIASFGEGGKANIMGGLDRTPEQIAGRGVGNGDPGQVYKNMIIIGSSTGEGVSAPPGDIRAFDVLTGKQVWTFHTIPRPGEYGYDTWHQKDAWKYIGGANNWGDMTLDVPNGIVFVPTGSPTSDFYGGWRHGDNLFGNSLLALDANTGKRLWHFQAIHHDLWDWDMVSAPQLVKGAVDGREREMVAMAGKTGFLYVLDRKTGSPIWPIEEKPVPASNVPGERASPTQPFPTKPPPFARQSFTAAEVNTVYFTPEETAYWKDFTAKAVNKGLFTPVELGKFTVAMPGSSGGAALYATSSDPANGIVYVNSFDFPAFHKLEPSRATNSNFTAFGPLISYIGGCTAEQGVCSPMEHSPLPEGGFPPDPLPYPPGLDPQPTSNYYTAYGMSLGMAGPPFTSITAYDLNKGEIKWKIPYGEAIGVNPPGNNYGLLTFHAAKAPPLVLPGLLLTASADHKFRAYDKETGKVIWSTGIPGPGRGALATYELDGRQFVVISTPAAMIAYALPR
jgi:quinoprotein glucose dehydrogenase